MNGGAASAVSGILVIDPSGAVFGLLRSLNLEVPLWRVANGDGLELDHIGLAVIAVDDHPSGSVSSTLRTRSQRSSWQRFPHDADAERAVASGALGYIDTRLPQDAMRRSILGAMHGELAHSRRLLADLIRSGRWLGAANRPPLTPQRQVITLIAKGATDKEIACSLGISTATAQKHVTNVLRRLNVPDRAAAVAATSAAYPFQVIDRSARSIA